MSNVDESLRKVLCVGVVGGSGCGKTTFARCLSNKLRGLNVVIISEDSYYHDVGGFDNFDPASYNFDDITARDHELIRNNLDGLLGRKPIYEPIYDFATHRRQAEGRIVEPADVLVVEGTHLLYSKEIRALFDVSVYLDVPDDIRFLRRLQRDIQERGRDLSSVINQYIASVRPMHHKFIEPTKTYADIIIRDDIAFSTRDECGVEKLSYALTQPVILAIENKMRGYICPPFGEINVPVSASGASTAANSTHFATSASSQERPRWDPSTAL